MAASVGFPEYGGLGDRIKRLEAQVDKLNRMTRLESATVGAGGLVFKDGGTASFLNSSGVADVVIDDTGLHVEGGDVRAIEVDGGSQVDAVGQAVTTTPSELVFDTITVPSWATSAVVFLTATLIGDNGGFGSMTVYANARVDGVDTGNTPQTADVVEISITDTRYVTMTPSGSTIRVSCYAYRSGGTGDPTFASSIYALALFLR